MLNILNNCAYANLMNIHVTNFVYLYSIYSINKCLNPQ